MRQMEQHVKWYFFGWKVIFSISDVSERFKESILNAISRFPANFKQISESQIFELSRDQTSNRAKISHFQNMLGIIQFGSHLSGVDASYSDPAKFQDDCRLKVGQMCNSKIKNWRKMANLTNEKDESLFSIARYLSPLSAIVRHCPPLSAM